MAKKPRSVTEEIRQQRPFTSPAQEALVTLLRTTDDVRRYLAGFMESEDVTLQQYNVLRILRGAGKGGLPTLEIGRRMLERQPGVTRLVDRLTIKGLVERARDPADRRRVVCTITTEGLELLDRVDVRMKQVDDDLGTCLPKGRLGELTRLLDALRAGLPTQ